MVRGLKKVLLLDICFSGYSSYGMKIKGYRDPNDVQRYGIEKLCSTLDAYIQGYLLCLASWFIKVIIIIIKNYQGDIFINFTTFDFS